MRSLSSAPRRSPSPSSPQRPWTSLRLAHRRLGQAGATQSQRQSPMAGAGLPTLPTQLSDTDEGSHEAVRRRARELVQELKEEPLRFEQIQLGLSHPGSMTWTEGQGDVREEAAA